MKTIDKPVKIEIKIKNSIFICRLFPVENQKETKEIINRISSEFHDATHNCTAYVLTDAEGYNDDGEPGGTAGRPMINVLRKNDLKNVLAIVTRYFGGIKLGAGGLVRAYSKSVIEAINQSEIIEIEFYDVYDLIFNYSDLKEIEQDIRTYKIHVINKEFNEKISYEIISDNIINFKEKIKEKVEINFKEKRALKKI